MKARQLVLLAALPLFLSEALAQTGPDQPPGPPPTPPATAPASIPPAPAPNGYGYSPGPDYTHMAGEISALYAFKYDAPGVSAELGAVFLQHNFFGGEVSYYGSDYKDYPVYQDGSYAGYYRAAQDITTVEAAYRYLTPLFGTGNWPPVAFYIGAGAGAGFVDYNNDRYDFYWHNRDPGYFATEGLAGLQFNFTPATALRIGYRYMYLNHVWQFGQHVNLESNVAEAGIAIRF